MRVINALHQNLVQTLHNEELFALVQIQEPILSDELENGSGVRHKEPIAAIVLEKQSQALLRLLSLL